MTEFIQYKDEDWGETEKLALFRTWRGVRAKVYNKVLARVYNIVTDKVSNRVYIRVSDRVFNIVYGEIN